MQIVRIVGLIIIRRRIIGITYYVGQIYPKLHALNGHTRVWPVKTLYERFPRRTWVWRRPVDIGDFCWLMTVASSWVVPESFHDAS